MFRCCLKLIFNVFMATWVYHVTDKAAKSKKGKEEDEEEVEEEIDEEEGSEEEVEEEEETEDEEEAIVPKSEPKTYTNLRILCLFFNYYD